MNKKAELTTQQIVTIIILVASFAVLLIFILSLNLGGTTNKEICHNSVVMIDKSAGFAGNLDCKTNYICISAGGDCAGMEKADKKSVDPKDKNAIMKIIADEMTNCWWTFGEGKIKYLSPDIFKGNHCATCAFVRFSGGFDKELFSYRELFNYSQTHEYQKGTSETYLQYLYNINDLNKLFEVTNFGKNLKQDNLGVFLDSKISSSENYTIITGVNPAYILNTWWVPSQFVRLKDEKEKTVCDVFDVTKS